MHFTITSVVIFLAMLTIITIPFKSEKKQNKNKEPFISFPKGALLPVALITFFASLGEGIVADWSAIFLRSIAELR